MPGLNPTLGSQVKKTVSQIIKPLWYQTLKEYLHFIVLSYEPDTKVLSLNCRQRTARVWPVIGEKIEMILISLNLLEKTKTNVISLL